MNSIIYLLNDHRELPNQIEFLYKEYTKEFGDNPIAWKGRIVREVSDPSAYLYDKIEAFESIRNLWAEWQVIYPNETELLFQSQQMLESCSTILTIMTEILFVEENAMLSPPITPSQTVALQPWEKLKKAFEEGSDPQEMQACFDSFLASPNDYIEIRGDQHGLKGFPFSHCACDSWNRETTTIRQEAERIIVDGIDRLRLNKEEQLRLAGFGSGGLLEDLIIVGKLIREKGFKNIMVRFFDGSSDPDMISCFAKMLNQLPGVTVEAKQMHYPSKQIKFHAIYGTDVDDLENDTQVCNCWSAVERIRTALEEEGKFYLFGSGKKLILDKRDTFIDLNEDNQKELEVIFNSLQLSKLSQLERIYIDVTKEGSSYDYPFLAALFHRLGKQFNKPINVRIFDDYYNGSAYSLKGKTLESAIRFLSGDIKLEVQYIKQLYESFPSKNLLVVRFPPMLGKVQVKLF